MEPDGPFPFSHDPASCATAELAIADFGAIVGAVYECVLDPTGWPAAIDRIRGAVGATAAWIGVHYPGQVRSVYEIEVGTTPEWQRSLRETYVPMSPFISYRHHARSGDILSVNDVVDYREFTEGRFAREWAGPQGLSDFIMAVLIVEADRYSWLGLCLPERASREQKARVSAFRPHVERALRISDLLEHHAAQAADLNAALESLATGVVMLGPGLAITGVNPAAHRLLRETGSLVVETGRLRCIRREGEAELRAAVAACAEGKLDRAGASVLLSDEEGGIALLAHILPLTRPRTSHGEQAVAALFLTQPGVPSQTPTQAFIRRYALTPSESRVLLALLEGKNPRAIAAAQGVAMPTIRTHLHRLYEKTGTSGQADIVRLMASVGRAI